MPVTSTSSGKKLFSKLVTSRWWLTFSQFSFLSSSSSSNSGNFYHSLLAPLPSRSDGSTRVDTTTRHFAHFLLYQCLACSCVVALLLVASYVLLWVALVLRVVLLYPWTLAGTAAASSQTPRNATLSSNFSKKTPVEAIIALTMNRSGGTSRKRRELKEKATGFSSTDFEKRAHALIRQMEPTTTRSVNVTGELIDQLKELLQETGVYIEAVRAYEKKISESDRGKSGGSGNNRTHYPPRVDMGACPPLFGRVGVMVAMREKEYKEIYHVAQQSLKCYLASTNYTYYAIDLETDPLALEHCAHHNDIFFKKHCAVAAHMHRLRGIVDWLLVTDADSGVIYPNHCLEEWIDDRVELIFYERFFNWEIASGNYFVRNTESAANFVKAWADWEFHLPRSYHGWDNGAIHMHIADRVLPEAVAERKACQTIWERAYNYGTYMAYVTCVKLALGAKRIFKESKLRIYRRAHAWVRDGYLIEEMWSERDFMIHGWKRQDVGLWPFPIGVDFNLSHCGLGGFSGWHWREERRRPTDEIRGHLNAAEKRQQAAFEESSQVLPFLVEPDIGECYPHCDDFT